MWSVFLVAWVLKMMALRVGGAKLYEGCGVPMASGTVTGYVMGMILSGLLWIVGLFIPF